MSMPRCPGLILIGQGTEFTTTEQRTQQDAQELGQG